MLTSDNIHFEKLSLLELQNTSLRQNLVTFIKNELGKYSDPEKDIAACLDYILNPDKGGHVFVARDENKELLGAVFLAYTDMKEFTPEYLLVYIATSSKHRGKGIGSKLMDLVRNTVQAPIALHVEHDNPAKELYLRLGFTNKYQEMRWYPDGKTTPISR